MGKAEMEAFLSHLAIEKQVAASTQNQALSALLFLYRYVLNQPFEQPLDALRAKRSRYLPTVLTRDEVLAVIEQLAGVYRLVIQVLYGSGLRLTEGLRLRIKDLDFAQQQILIRDTKGAESRVTTLPECLIERLKDHLQGVKRLHQSDTPGEAGGLMSVTAPRADVLTGGSSVSF